MVKIYRVTPPQAKPTYQSCQHPELIANESLANKKRKMQATALTSPKVGHKFFLIMSSYDHLTVLQ